MAEDGSDFWRGVIEKLEADRAKVAEQEATAAAEARPLALPAATGDGDAAGKLAKVNARRNALARQAETLDLALGSARDQLAAAQQREQAALAAERLARQRELALVVREAEAEVDATFGAAARALGKYAAAVDTLRRAGLQNPYGTKLLNRTMLMGSLHLAGISAVVPLPPVSPGHRRTLADWSRAMTAHLDPPPAAEPVQAAAMEVA
jgi:hypothetical protein